MLLWNIINGIVSILLILKLRSTTGYEIPVVEYLMDVDRRGTYVVKEQIEKAPVYTDVCNRTKTAIEMSFPEIKHELFVNFLGYKGSNMIYLNRCKGLCENNVNCRPSKVRQT